MTVLQVPDMHCDSCVQRITRALSALGIDHEVRLEAKQVVVRGDDSALTKAKEALDDLGFEVAE